MRGGRKATCILLLSVESRGSQASHVWQLWASHPGDGIMTECGQLPPSLRIINVSQPWLNRTFRMAVLPAPECFANSTAPRCRHVTDVGDRYDGVSSILQRSGFWEVRTVHEAVTPIRGLLRMPPVLGASDRDQSGGTRRALFVDVGANLGYFSVMMALAGYRVVAIEARESHMRPHAALSSHDHAACARAEPPPCCRA